MPRLEYRGIFARPGWYNYPTGKEYKSFEELKRAAQRQPELMVTLGHPRKPDGTPRLPTVSDYVGRMVQVVNDDRELIEMVFKPHEEHWDKIPEELRERLEADLAVAISGGFTVDKVVNDIQEGLLYNHVGLVRDSEDPLCPLGECGINVRVETSEGEYVLMRYEQTSETKDPEPEDKDEASETPKYVTAEDLDRFKDALLDELRPKAEAGAEPVEEVVAENSDEKSEPEPVPEPVKESPPEPSLEPERAFPAGKVAGRDIKSEYVDEDGTLKIPSEIYLGATKKKQ